MFQYSTLQAARTLLVNSKVTHVSDWLGVQWRQYIGLR